MNQKKIDQNILRQPVLAVPQAIPRVGKMLKIKDFVEESNLKNSVDIVAVIAKVGQMQMATQSSKGPVPARAIYLCDDSWAMIKLIARDFFAECSANFQSDQILHIKNVKPMKLRGYVVLATMPDTLLSLEANIPEAIRLRFWLADNKLDFKQDGLQRFSNLSSEERNSSSPSSSGTLELQCSQSSQSLNVTTASQMNDSGSNKITSNMKAEKSPTEKSQTVEGDNKKRKHSSEEEDSTVKCIKSDLAESTVKATNLEDSSISDSATQKFNLDTSVDCNSTVTEKTTNKKDSLADIFTVGGKTNNTKGSPVIIDIDSDDDIMTKEKVNEHIKKEVLEKEETDAEVIDEDEDFLICETYKTLMNYGSTKDWDEKKDRHLIHFLSKHALSTKQLTDAIYLKLLQANPNVFQDSSIDELKSRVEILATPKNYIYLLKLCGGKKIKNEKDKCMFIDQVERIRRLMRGKEVKEETIE